MGLGFHRPLAAWLLPACLLAGAASAQIGIGGDPSVDPADFRITVFATGLTYPTSMQQAGDGSLIVLTNDPSSGLFDSAGEIQRLVDADDDGVSDGPATTLFSGLPGIATSLRKVGPLVFVSSRELDNEAISILRTGATPAAAYSLLGTLDLVYPAAAVVQNHRNVALAARPTPAGGGTVDLVFNIGSEDNSSATTDTVSGQGLLSGVAGAAAMNMDSLYQVTVQDTGGVPVLSNLTQLATGLRNAAGIAFDPAGNLWFADNGIDPSGGAAQSADELNRIAAADLGGAIEEFGFPEDYISYTTGLAATGLSIQPLVAYLRTPDIATGARSEGPVEIALTPAAFPVPLQGGMFVGFHGRFSNSGAANDENPVVFTELGPLAYFHFVSTSEPALGHPNGLLATPRSLFIADLTATGSTSSNSANGVIHQIQAVAPLPAFGNWPIALVASAFLLGTVAAARRLQRPPERAPRS